VVFRRKWWPRCGARTRQARPCRMAVEPGKRRCKLHGGPSTGPRTEAGRARIAAAQRRRWEQFRQSKTPMTRARARAYCSENFDGRLPSPADNPPSGPDWVHEIKHDGFRLMVRRDSVGIRLLTRRGNSGRQVLLRVFVP
jgi:hypothetical protein